ncbi:MAG: type 4a pilus biogenesis protein PilO [bacterium]|nr:type 4a pilus biogenesis protein PilO [bacterium]
MKVDILQALKPIFLSLILICVVTYGFSTYMYKPMREKGMELDRKIVEKQRELDETQKIVDNLDIKRAEFEKVKKELEFVIKRLPSKQEMPQLLKTITKLALKSNIELISFKPQLSVRKEVYEEVPVSLHIKGTYHSVGFFLTQVGNLERIITPSNVKMNSLIPSAKDPSTASADLTITAFVYKEH